MKKLILISPIIFLTLIFNVALAEEVTVWGPNKYLRAAGSPNNYTSVFSTTPGQGKLVVKNGTMGGNNRVQDSLSSTTISVNGKQIFGPSDFNKQVYLLEALLNLAENNEFFIELASSTGSYLTIEIIKDIDLPPDPGDAGKGTLLGIDSDNDGVRDDIQRYIYFTYPDDRNLRMALIQIARVYQDLILTPNDREIAHENVKKLYRSFECLSYINSDFENNRRIKNILRAEFLNTKERSKAYLAVNNAIAGKTTKITPIDERKDCCLFDVDNSGGL